MPLVSLDALPEDAVIGAVVGSFRYDCAQQ